MGLGSWDSFPLEILNTLLQGARALTQMIGGDKNTLICS